MHYGHGPGGITFNQHALKRWTLSLHVCRITKDLSEMSEVHIKTDHLTTHKQGSAARRISAAADRKKIKSKMLSFNPFEVTDHSDRMINIGKLAPTKVNVEKSPNGRL